MKKWIRDILLFTIPILLLSVTFNEQARAEGEGNSCTIDTIGLEAVPSYLEIGGRSQDTCALGQRQLGEVVVRATQAQIVVRWVDVTPETSNDNVFLNLSSGHLGMPLDTTAVWSFAFTPRLPGEYKGIITYTYAYGERPLSAYRECINRSFANSLDPKRKIVAEMEVVGPDYRMINARLEKVENSYDEKIKQARRDLQTAEGKIAAINREMDKVLDELKKGAFCSTCGKSRSEFEKMGLDFDDHIREGEASGRYARSATQKELDDKRRYYENQKRPHEVTAAAARSRIPIIEKEHDDQIKELAAQRIAFKEAFDKRLAALKLAIINIESRYELAKQQISKFADERRVSTSRIGGICRAKRK